MLALAVAQRLELVVASAWRAEGRPVPRAALDALDEWLAWQTACLQVADEIRAAGPSARILKGPAIGRSYPAPWVRPFFDLDVEFATPEDLWRVLRALVATGWSVTALTVARIGDADALTVAAERPASGYAAAAADVVELSSIPFWGDPDLGVAGAASLPGADEAPLARQLVALLEERFQRPFDGRDLLDAICLLRAFDSTDRRWLRTTIEALGIQPEWGELRRIVQRGPDGLAREVAMSLPGAGRESLGRRVRRARRIASAAGVARAAMRRATTGPQARHRGRLVRALHRVVPPAYLYRHGRPLHGFALAVPAPALERPRVTRAGRQQLLETPIGTFLLVSGAVVDAAWVAEAVMALDA